MSELAASGIVAASGLPVTMTIPRDPAPHACVILLHERYGLAQHTLDLARRLAAHGYVVATPDLFHDAPDRTALARGESKVPSDDVRASAQLAEVVAALETVPSADPSRLAIVGVCQTGRIPIVVDAERPLRACAVLYGAAQDREWERHERFPVPLATLLARGRAPVLGMFGALDHAISLDHVRRFRNALEDARRSYRITVFPDAPHGWLNDTMPGRYRPAQAAAAWDELTTFLAAHLGAKPPDDDVRWHFASTTSAAYDFRTNRRME